MQNLEKVFKTWEQMLSASLPKVLLAVVVLLLFFVLARVVRLIILKSYFKTTKFHPSIANIVASIAYFFLVFSGVFLSLQVVGLEKILTNLLAGAGIVGIIAGFAFKDIASNIFGGLLLKLQGPFKKDDWVQINGNYGEVLEVGWITTSIKTITGQEVFVPNQIVYSNTFTNYSTFKKRRIIFEIGLAYTNDLEQVKAVALDEVQKMQELLPNEEFVCYFSAIKDSAVKLQVSFWILFQEDSEYCRAVDDVIMRLKKRFEAENIKIA